MGVKAATVSPKTGDLAVEVCVTDKTYQVVITSRNGQVIKLPVKNIPKMGRSTQGVILMRFAKSGDGVAAAAVLDRELEEEDSASGV
jgi:DNA gyrase subunit A